SPYLHSFPTRRSSDLPSLIGINDALLNGLIKNLVDLSLERRKLLSIVNDNHPDVLVLDQQVQRVRDNVFENINNLIKNTESRKRSEEHTSELQSRFDL